MAAAGIDASNVDKTHLVLLPVDPDASARRLRAGLRERGLDVAVVISDTMGRTWRNGLTDVALGAAGIEPVRDHRGQIDPYGNELHVTQIAVIDELAAAGELVKGKMDQVPVAVVRGYPRDGAADGPGAVALVRDADSDMFSLGTAEARAAGLRAAATLGETEISDAVDTGAVDRALAAVADVVAANTVISHVEGGAVLHLSSADMSRSALIRLGADAHRLRAALAAEGVPSQGQIRDDGVWVRVSA
jgi:coenzyme F420-0:L-glutamate ligase/coenzyme F420-1:gamma-L-glutamate ligase